MTQVTLNNLDNVAGGALSDLSTLALNDSRLLSLDFSSIPNMGMPELTPEQLQELAEIYKKMMDYTPQFSHAIN